MRFTIKKILAAAAVPATAVGVLALGSGVANASTDAQRGECVVDYAQWRLSELGQQPPTRLSAPRLRQPARGITGYTLLRRRIGRMEVASGTGK